MGCAVVHAAARDSEVRALTGWARPELAGRTGQAKQRPVWWPAPEKVHLACLGVWQAMKKTYSDRQAKDASASKGQTRWHFGRQVTWLWVLPGEDHGLLPARLHVQAL